MRMTEDRERRVEAKDTDEQQVDGKFQRVGGLHGGDVVPWGQAEGLAAPNTSQSPEGDATGGRGEKGEDEARLAGTRGSESVLRGQCGCHLATTG